MKNYLVSIEIKSIYTVEIEASSGEGARSKGWQMSTAELRDRGSLKNITTDVVEITRIDI